MSNIIEIGGGGSSSAVLISKVINANGTYSASSESADGYDVVTVNVPNSVLKPLVSSEKYAQTSGYTGTNVSKAVQTFTITEDGVLVFGENSYAVTNTSSNDGYIDIRINNISILKKYLPSNTNTSFSVPNTAVSANDVLTICVGYDNSHSNCYFNVYTAVTLCGASVPKITLNSGKLDVRTGIITADPDYYYSDLFPCPLTTAFFDVGESSSGSTLGFAIYDTNGDYTEYFTANARYRTVDITNYIVDPTGYSCRLSFAKSHLTDVIFRDISANIIYANADFANLDE